MAAPPVLFFYVATLCHLTVSSASSPSGDRPPRITEHPSDTTVARGSPAMLNCKADGSPAPSIHWERDGRPVEAPSPTWVALPSGSLFVLAVARADAGRYRCVAVNRAGEASSREAVLTAAVLREEFRVSPQDTEVSVGSRVTLRCSPPKGDPPPTVGWIKDYSQVDFNEPHSRFSLAGEGDLVIPNVTLSDTGTYWCVAKNYAGMKRRSRPAQLAVSELPPPPANVTAVPADGRSALVTWEVTGDPAMTPLQPEGYQVYARSEAGHRSRLRADANTSQVTLSNLTTGATYTIWVTSVSPGGESVPSPPVTLQLPDAAPPLSPPVSLDLPPPGPDGDLTSDLAPVPAGGPRRPPAGHIWLAAAVSTLVLLTLSGLAISGWVRRVRRKQQSESDEKRRDGVSLLPSSVRPASWMEGSVWSAELTGRRTESDRNPPTGTGGRGRGLVDSVPSPTPYATTALLQTGSDDSWMDSCRKSRDISTSSFGVFSTRGSGRSSDCSARYSRPHRVTSQNGDVIRVTAPRQGVEDDTAEVMACGVFPFECQPGTRGHTDPLWRVREHQGVPRDAYQPLLGDPSRRGGESCAAGSHQGRLSFIGEGPVSADRRDIYREEGSSFYGPSSAGGPSQDNKRASARY
ncbi:neogenin-like [Amphibalanus amphitrite]|uniref:neogenin-like n=1 Tax=Amphibalanus amphitrite TaxID=1232801 RepID=UPI001C8FFEBF|nr:neogenin-like [Amphibalanus amphitrite]